MDHRYGAGGARLRARGVERAAGARRRCPAGPGCTGTLLIGNKGENTVSFVDLATGRELGRAATGPMPHEIAVSPDGRQAAVVAYGGRTIDIFDVAHAREAADHRPFAQ